MNQKIDEKAAKTETLEGVIDQTKGVFAIAGAVRIRPIAKLRAAGFTENNFARFPGLKVRIKGSMATGQHEKVLSFGRWFAYTEEPCAISLPRAERRPTALKSSISATCKNL